MKVIIAIVVTFLITGLIFGGGYIAIKVKGGLIQNTYLAVRIESPQRGDLIEVITAPGEIEPIHKVEIRSKVSAQIIELPYKERDQVTKGDPNAHPPLPASVLMRLESKDIQAELQGAIIRKEARAKRQEVAKVRLESRQKRMVGDRAVLKQAEDDLRSKEELLKHKDITELEVEQARSNVTNLQSQIISSELSLKADELDLAASEKELIAADTEITRLQEQLKYTIFTSPINGVVTRVNAEVGEMATGSMYNPGNLVLEVADLTKMTLVAQITEADIVKLKVGQQAKVRIQAWPGRIFEGVVASTALAPTLGRTGEKYFRTKIVLDNKDGTIYAGLTADVDIEIKTYNEVLTVPSQAVMDWLIDDLPVEVRDKNPNIDTSKLFAAVVFRYVNGEATATPVKFGQSDATDTIITSGLNEEDKVIIGPYKILEGLTHKQKVKDEKEMTEQERKASKAIQDQVLKSHASVNTDNRRR